MTSFLFHCTYTDVRNYYWSISITTMTQFNVSLRYISINANISINRRSRIIPSTFLGAYNAVDFLFHVPGF